ncbi:hypothetical protein FOCC_FOCC009403 [Frankliniella occidentalis]|nr:hypothetical protein FOCC_FOCC009403 [Frankliniella occidentalis]
MLGLGRCPVRVPATLEEAGYLVEHCKRLLDVVVSLYPPINSYTCLAKMHLSLFTSRKLMEIDGLELDGNQRTVNSEIEKICW